MNSIKTNNGSNANGQPAGTNNEKNSNPCLLSPNIVAPKTSVKLSENVKIKWLVEAKLYGTIPIKLFTNMKTNNTYIKGKYACPLLSFIWLITILCTVAYIVSWDIDQAFETTLLLLVERRFNTKTKYPPIVRYNPMFVKDKDKLPKIGASILNKFLISNWSSGLVILKK